MNETPLRCHCGAVRGVVTDLVPANVSRCVCYCRDCRAFAHFLGRSELLDAHGGSEILQLAPSRVRLTEGCEQLRCMRLSDRGMFRFYAGCCRSPLGNSIGPRIGFVGILRQALDEGLEGRSLDDVLGTTYRVHGRFAIGTPPPDAHPTASPRFVLRVASLVGRWTLRGRHQPSPYYDERLRLRVEPEVLTPAQRAAL